MKSERPTRADVATFVRFDAQYMGKGLNGDEPEKYRRLASKLARAFAKDSDADSAFELGRKCGHAESLAFVDKAREEASAVQHGDPCAALDMVAALIKDIES